MTKSIKRVVIDKSVKVIAQEAFEHCTELVDVEFHDAVTQIGIAAFRGCSSLEVIILPPSLKRICRNTFYGCVSLRKIHIPKSVAVIRLGAFFGCSSLEGIDIPNGITRISTCAFYKCSSLKTIMIPRSIISIGYLAFGCCSSLEVFIIPSSSSITYIEPLAFRSCQLLSLIEIPSYTRIAPSAFDECEALKKLCGSIPMIPWLKHRLDHLPLHRLCYQAATDDTKILTQKLAQCLATNSLSCLLRQTDATGWTALHFLLCSSASVQVEVIVLVLKAVVDASISLVQFLATNNMNSLSPIEYAVQEGDTSTLLLILSLIRLNEYTHLTSIWTAIIPHLNLETKYFLLSQDIGWAER